MYCTRVIGARSSDRWAAFDRMAHAVDIPYVPEYPETTYPIPPCLGNGSVGYASLWHTYLRIWRSPCPQEWTLVLENDAILHPLVTKGLIRNGLRSGNASFAPRTQLGPVRVVWFDSRNGFRTGAPGCCTVGVAYHRSVLPMLIDEFDLENRKALWNDRDRWGAVKDPRCLTDHYLANVVHRFNVSALSFPAIGHNDTARSEIRPTAPATGALAPAGASLSMHVSQSYF